MKLASNCIDQLHPITIYLTDIHNIIMISVNAILLEQYFKSTE